MRKKGVLMADIRKSKDGRQRSVEEMKTEHRQLQNMYDKLPEDKKARHSHIPDRMAQLETAIAGKPAAKPWGFGKILTAILIGGAVAFAVGFAVVYGLGESNML